MRLPRQELKPWLPAGRCFADHPCGMLWLSGEHSFFWAQSPGRYNRYNQYCFAANLALR
jgi:hypothetical protein